MAVAVPTIGPFLALIGAFCFSILGLIIPALIETVTFWEKGFGPGNWVAWKNAFMFAFGVLALVFGSYTSMVDIIRTYGFGDPIIQEIANIPIAEVRFSFHIQPKALFFKLELDVGVKFSQISS